MKTSEYGGIDRLMSSWVVSCTKLTTRIYLTDDGLGTDILARAAVWRWEDAAERAAISARSEYAWTGFDWRPMCYAEAVAP